jgi:hypothetical protein
MWLWQLPTPDPEGKSEFHIRDFFMTSDLDGLTTEKGCFNCKKFDSCPHIKKEKEYNFDYYGVYDFEGKKYRYGCCCTDYENSNQKEKVQFS